MLVGTRTKLETTPSAAKAQVDSGAAASTRNEEFLMAFVLLTCKIG